MESHRIKTATKGDTNLATGIFDGVRKEISLSLIQGARVGDYVIVHVGYALQLLDPEEAAQTLALFAELASQT